MKYSIYDDLYIITDDNMCMRIGECRLVFPLAEEIYCYSSIK